MNRVLLAAVFALPLLSGTAFAADLGRAPVAPVAPYIPPPVFTWTGFYIGANVGYGWASGATRFTPLPSAAAFVNLLPQSVANDPNGVLGGVQVGYNWQTGAFVLGVEADIDAADLSKTSVVSPIIQNNGTPAPAGTFLSTGQKTNWLGTLRARLGYAATDRLLIYATGGLAYGNVRYTANTSGGVGGISYPASFSKGKTGWTVGGGAEYALSANWTAKLEYLYYDLGNQSAIVNPIPANPPFQVGYRWRTTGQLVRVGLNYKF